MDNKTILGALALLLGVVMMANYGLDISNPFAIAGIIVFLIGAAVILKSIR